MILALPFSMAMAKSVVQRYLVSKSLLPEACPTGLVPIQRFQQDPLFWRVIMVGSLRVTSSLVKVAVVTSMYFLVAEKPALTWFLSAQPKRTWSPSCRVAGSVTLTNVSAWSVNTLARARRRKIFFMLFCFFVIRFLGLPVAYYFPVPGIRRPIFLPKRRAQPSARRSIKSQGVSPRGVALGSFQFSPSWLSPVPGLLSPAPSSR